MLLLDGVRAQLEGKLAELLAWLPRFAPAVRITVALRLGRRDHARVGEVVELTLEQPTSIGDGSTSGGFDAVSPVLLDELGELILAHAPHRFGGLVRVLPDDLDLLSELASKAIAAEVLDGALAVFDRLIALPIPRTTSERASYLVAIDHACIQSRRVRAYETAVRLAARVQSVAHEHPQLFHSAACAYVAVADYAAAFEQVRLALAHDYEHAAEIEDDEHLGPLREWPEFKTLFRDWHARQEGN